MRRIQKQLELTKPLATVDFPSSDRCQGLFFCKENAMTTSFHEFVTETLAITSRAKWIRLGYQPSSIFLTSIGTWAFHMSPSNKR